MYIIVVLGFPQVITKPIYNVCVKKINNIYKTVYYLIVELHKQNANLSPSCLLIIFIIHALVMMYASDCNSKIVF